MSLVFVTQLVKEKNWIQTRFTLLKHWPCVVSCPLRRDWVNACFHSLPAQQTILDRKIFFASHWIVNICFMKNIKLKIENKFHLNLLNNFLYRHTISFIMEQEEMLDRKVVYIYLTVTPQAGYHKVNFKWRKAGLTLEFSSLKLVIVPRLKNPVCLSIYP